MDLIFLLKRLRNFIKLCFSKKNIPTFKDDLHDTFIIRQLFAGTDHSSGFLNIEWADFVHIILLKGSLRYHFEIFDKSRHEIPYLSVCLSETIFVVRDSP